MPALISRARHRADKNARIVQFLAAQPKPQPGWLPSITRWRSTLDRLTPARITRGPYVSVEQIDVIHHALPLSYLRPPAAARMLPPRIVHQPVRVVPRIGPRTAIHARSLAPCSSSGDDPAAPGRAGRAGAERGAAGAAPASEDGGRLGPASAHHDATAVSSLGASVARAAARLVARGGLDGLNLPFTRPHRGASPVSSINCSTARTAGLSSS